jgi:putative membrane protein insertion efficiency factor
VIAAVRAYQVALSPLLGPGKCRFYPSCSEYAVEVVARDGPWAGGKQALRRLSRCHPFSGRGGVDLP